MALRPIAEVAAELGLAPGRAIPWGPDVAKVDLAACTPAPPSSALVLVSAMTPTKWGEGKTTVSVGLAMGLWRIGVRAVVALREPSLGPVFGLKGGGTGGGRAQLEPAARINLHFTGDLHAVTAAHDLLAAMVDSDLHFGAPTGLDPRRVTWPRVLDVDDRALRSIVVGLGGRNGGVTRETRFDITAASEVMAVLCLARSRADLRARLGRIVVGSRADGSDVTAEDVGAADAMAVLLDEALGPNLVQTREGGPALVHGGPFANIAHGCSSVLATHLAMAHAEVAITEAGFGFELGGEKMLELACRQAGIWPRLVVLVVTCRALAAHGRGSPGDIDAIRRGLAHLDHQVGCVRAFGLSPVMALNVFEGDADPAFAEVEGHAARIGVRCARITAFNDGGAGAEGLAREVVAAVEATKGAPPEPRYLYALESDARVKVHAIATTLYGASRVDWSDAAARGLSALEKNGYGALPVCIAKTHLALGDNPNGPALPDGRKVTVTSVRLAAGAGFLVALMGEVRTMPGLPREPAAKHMRVDADGRIHGLMQDE